MAAQDERAGIAIDLAEDGLGCDDILQSIGKLACLAIRHLRPPWLVDARMPYSTSIYVNLDQANQYVGSLANSRTGHCGTLRVAADAVCVCEPRPYRRDGGARGAASQPV